MKITRITAGEIEVPLKVPFKTAVRTVTHVHSLVLKVELADGCTGYGEAPATAVITGDTIDSMRAGLAVLAPQLLGREIGDFNRLLLTVQRGVVHHSSLKAALEMALFDLRAQLLGLPLYALLGAAVSADARIKTDVTISLNDAATMVRDAKTAVAAGFDALKVKVGGRRWQDDVAAMLAIHEAVGSAVKIRLDANQGWTPKQAVQVIQAVERAGIEIEFVEQPVKADDIAGLKFVTDHTLTPILADEAVFGVMDAVHILSTQSADVLNIKFMKTGGISQAMEIAQLARRYHRQCMIGCMLESHISVTAAAHFAYAFADVVTLIDLDGPALCNGSAVKGGLAMQGAWIHLPTAHGLGIEEVLNLQRPHEYTA
jgi:L-Ala-D/L-Glu epimerase